MAENEAGARPAPTRQQSGCLVDWTWLEGAEIASVRSDLQNLIVTLKSGQTLKVRALMYKGEPFLSFDPYYPPKQ